MKNLLAALAFVALGALQSTAQTAAEGPVMTFEQTTIDYGTIFQGSEPLRQFKFTNTGSEPLIIKDARGSCGCTVPTYPQEPVMPGESATIDVRYDTQRIGAFTKTVTLTTNEATESRTLTIKGDVKELPQNFGTPTTTNGFKQ
ncbi:MAG: DUF1573 domain-containing protein [Saprospiraceae bacterium]